MKATLQVKNDLFYLDLIFILLIETEAAANTTAVEDVKNNTEEAVNNTTDADKINTADEETTNQQ